MRAHRVWNVGGVVVAALLAGACSSSGHTGSGSAVDPGDDVVVLCDRYATTVRKQAMNQRRLTVDAAVEELRSTKVDASAWSDISPSAVVARCDFAEDEAHDSPLSTTHCK